MTGQDLCLKLYRLSFTCCKNIRYYQSLSAMYTRWDRWLRIAVGGIAAICLCLAVPPLVKDHDPVGWIGFVASFAALLVAIALNVIPIGDWAKFNGELYRLWSDLNRDVVIEELKAAERNEGKNVKEGHVARLGELLSKVEARTPWIIQAIASF